MNLFKALLFTLFYSFGAVAAQAQITTLLADNVNIQGDNTIIATGNVEILAGDARLSAASITYNATTNSLSIEGPIVLIQGAETLFLASSAELDTDFKNGILRSARMVLDQQLQIAAAEINRVGGRYTQLYKTVASSCKICAGSSVPLWEIRSTKIIHDQLERQLYFENATLRVGNIPVFYIPRLRLPDPTLKRATGFLTPKIRTSSRLGTGMKIPYFVKIGDHADVTFTPYLSSDTRTLEMQYRQAFKTGRLQFDAALTNDSLLPGSNRAYLFGNGRFALPRGFDLKFNFEIASDPAYLLDYGFSGKDRLDSEIAITRTRAQDYFNAGLINFTTLRGSELAIDDQLPNFQGEILYERRFYPNRLGGQGRWSIGLESHNRSSTVDQLGRDVTHIGGRINWGRSTTLGNGMVARVAGELVADTYLIAQDTTYANSLSFVTPAAEAELRWPLVKTGSSGAALVFEPVVHLVWTRNLGASVPNEDSTLVEFDEGNLFSISRFPGDDRFENGTRATLGFKWTRFDPQGWSLGVAMGRVYRDSDLGQFTTASGLDGIRSDWLAAGQVKFENKLAVTARALVADDFSITKAETQISWASPKMSLATTYSWIVPDVAESRPDVTSQMTFDGKFTIKRNWNANLELLYDFEARKGTKAALGLVYSNECISVDLSLSRRFTSSTSVTPTTDVGLSVTLLGFGSGRGTTARTCNGL